MTQDRSFRDLYAALDGATGRGEARAVLRSWSNPARTLLDPLRPLGAWEAHTRLYRRTDDPPDEDLLAALWDLYALSRVSDLLLLPFQTGPYDGSATYGPPLHPEERVAFFTALGLERSAHTEFHPFYHEIVAVDVAPAGSPATVVEEIWPGFLLDHLLICRAGVRVQAGTDRLLKPVAERSTLFWSYRRRNRPCRDLSLGWGSNSQWRTRFRRDYTDGATIIYNADGTLDARLPDSGPHPDPDREDLTPEERVELLIHRCFVRTRKPDAELFPYKDTLTLSSHSGTEGF